MSIIIVVSLIGSAEPSRVDSYGGVRTYIWRASQDLRQRIAESHALTQNDGQEIRQRVDARGGNVVLDTAVRKRERKIVWSVDARIYTAKTRTWTY